MFRIAFGIFLTLCVPVWASAWEVRNTFEDYNYYSYLKPVSDSADVTQLGVVDLRDNFNFLTETTKWVVRPRWTLTVDDGSSQGKLDLTAGYLDWDLSSQWKAVIGLQVYQWGPGELINSSNIFFHLQPDQRSFYFLQKGQVLARLNWTVDNHWNFILISEPISNQDPEFQADTSFEAKSALKAEYRGDGASYLGAVAGTEGTDRPYFGEYLNLSLSDEFSLYADLRHSFGNYSYQSSVDQNGFVELTTQTPNKSEIYTLALWGVRYEGRVDLRVEWLYNDQGWDADQLKTAITGVSTLGPYFYQNLRRYQRSGLELPGQNYLYISLRIPDLGKKKDATVFLRNILSMQDQSGLTQVSGEKAIGDSVTFALELQKSYGNQNSEFHLLSDLEARLGFRWAL